MVTQISQVELQYESIIALSLITYVLSMIALREDLSGIEFLTLLILPTLFTASVSLFYFVLPQRLLTGLPIALLYAIGIYAILLTENIYNVAAERNIQLLRAAQSVGFLITLITAFFLFDAVLSLHRDAIFNAVLVFIITFPLALQSLWSMELQPKLSFGILIGSMATALILSEIAFVFSFWPIRTTIESLFLATLFYTIVGMSQQHLVGRLFQATKKEFILVLVAVFFLVLFTTKWGFGHFVN